LGFNVNWEAEIRSSFPKFIGSALLLFLFLGKTLLHFRNARQSNPLSFFTTQANYSEALQFFGFLNERFFFSPWMMLAILVGFALGMNSIQESHRNNSLVFILANPTPRWQVLAIRMTATLAFLLATVLLLGLAIIVVILAYGIEYPLPGLGFQLLRLFSLTLPFWSLGLLSSVIFKSRLSTLSFGLAIAGLLWILDRLFTQSAFVKALPFHFLSEVSPSFFSPHDLRIFTFWALIAAFLAYLSIVLFQAKEV
jgi:hypothetical protein